MDPGCIYQKNPYVRRDAAHAEATAPDQAYTHELSLPKGLLSKTAGYQNYAMLDNTFATEQRASTFPEQSGNHDGMRAARPSHLWEDGDLTDSDADGEDDDGESYHTSDEDAEGEPDDGVEYFSDDCPVDNDAEGEGAYMRVLNPRKMERSTVP